MLAAVYVMIACLLFFAQLRNGFFTSVLTAAFWPIVLAGMTLFSFFSMLYHVVKK